MIKKPAAFRRVCILLLAVLLAACGPKPTETPIPSASITVTNITEKNTVEGQIIQKKTFNQCDSASSIKATVQFSETSGQTSQKELVLKESGGLQVEFPKLAKLQVEAAVEEHFAVTREEARTTQESISIEVPARTRQEYTIIWKETRREGTIEYVENGEKKFINYSYRLGVELDSSSVKNIDCSFPTETPIPTFTPPPTITAEPTVAGGEPTAAPRLRTLRENCIDPQVWTPDSTDLAAMANLSLRADGCYALEGLGIFTDGNGTLHLNYKDQRTAIASGIYTPIKNNSVIEFKIHVNSMYAVYADNPVTISFAVAPQDDPMTARNTARFKLHVETPGDRPIIFFVLADVNENSGTKVGSQHYEYGQTYTIRLELVGNSMKVYINNVKMTEELLIPTGQKVFYIGYNVPIIAGVDVEVSEVTIDGQPK
jgi:hypothetical protein